MAATELVQIYPGVFIEQEINYDRVYRDDAKRYYLKGMIHRVDGPAVIWPDGETRYVKNGHWSCHIGPSKNEAGGRKIWLHRKGIYRDDGPSWDSPNGFKVWSMIGDDDSWPKLK